MRHTFASRLMVAGVDAKTVMELGGWSRLEMLQRYAHSGAEHKRRAVEILAESSKKSPQKSQQSEIRPSKLRRVKS
ncbi:MAG: tyrosine-type recombinase/integrase, partial [Vicinamibacteria bacterium]